MKNINFKYLGKAFLIIFLAYFIIPQIIALICLPLINNSTNSLIIINLIAYLIDVALIFFIYRHDLKKEWLKYTKNFKEYSKMALKNWGIGFLLMIIFNIIVISITGSLATNESENRELLNSLPIFSIIAMVFLGPILEEFSFRKGFKKAFNNKQLFLIMSALFFGLIHVINNLDYTSITSFLASCKELLFIFPYGILGYFFAKAYYESDCIFTSIMAHMFHNGLSIIIILLGSIFI